MAIELFEANAANKQISVEVTVKHPYPYNFAGIAGKRATGYRLIELQDRADIDGASWQRSHRDHGQRKQETFHSLTPLFGERRVHCGACSDEHGKAAPKRGLVDARLIITPRAHIAIASGALVASGRLRLIERFQSLDM